METKEEIEKRVEAKHGIRPGQIYLDNDKRMTGRRLKVLGVTLRAGKASCASCDIHGSVMNGRTVWISFNRLATKSLFTRVE